MLSRPEQSLPNPEIARSNLSSEIARSNLYSAQRLLGAISNSPHIPRAFTTRRFLFRSSPRRLRSPPRRLPPSHSAHRPAFICCLGHPILSAQAMIPASLPFALMAAFLSHLSRLSSHTQLVPPSDSALLTVASLLAAVAHCRAPRQRRAQFVGQLSIFFTAFRCYSDRKIMVTPM